MGTAPPSPWHQRVKDDKFMQKMSLTKTRSLTFA